MFPSERFFLVFSVGRFYTQERQKKLLKLTFSSCFTSQKPGILTRLCRLFKPTVYSVKPIYKFDIRAAFKCTDSDHSDGLCGLNLEHIKALKNPSALTHFQHKGGVGLLGSHLEHEVDSTSVRSDSHSAAFWDRLVGCQRDDGLRVRQGLNLQAVFLQQRHGCSIYALQVA